MRKYLDDLNEEQRKAVENIDGPSLVIAGAGSGKTRVLTYRIAHLLSLGKKPSAILALTFTNKAAKEMKQRVAELTDEKSSNRLWMGTFHSLFSKILRIEHEAIGYPADYTIYDTIDSKNVIKSVVKELNLDKTIYKPNDVFSRISWAKNNLITPAGYENNTEIVQQDTSRRKPSLAKIYRTYVNRCFQAGAMDFDDLLLQTNILFRDNTEILKKYQEKFHYILVDEYQDTNYSQYLIIKKLSQKNKNICIVGDDAQSIYGFRGARIENILNFRNDFPEHKLYKLERNYRSTQNIVNAANSIILKNESQIPKTVYSKNDTGLKIKIQSTFTDIEEGAYVADQIKQSHLSEHYNFSDYAILYRTNYQSRIFEEALRKQNIPYKIYGGLSFYQRKEIKDLLAYFRTVVNPHDDEAVKRIVNYPKRGIGDSSVAKIEKQAFDANQSIWATLQNIDNQKIGIGNSIKNRLREFIQLINTFREESEKDAYTLAREIASEAGIFQDLYKDKSPEGLGRHENIQELLNGIREFVNQNERPAEELTLDNYLSEVSLLTTLDENEDEDPDKVTLMTIHSAKGLEFKNLFIVGVEEELFPSKFSVASQKELEEERRLFYVAVTRAEQNLTITYSKQRYRWGSLIPTTPSRFLRDIDEHYLDTPDEEIHSSKTYTRQEPVNHAPTQKKPSEETGKSSTQSSTKSGYKNISKARNQKLRAGSNDSLPGDFKIYKPEELEIGAKIEHSRFGQGTVEEITGTFPNAKAIINFNEKGKKQILLKFAKIKIVEN